MSQREPDDTTKPDAPPTRERETGGYYYDDATGYEIYKPEEDKDDEETRSGDQLERSV
jgi:hypothetical protein